MSHETYAWAKEQRCGDPVTKAVLLEIANWAKPTGVVEFLSVDRIADVVEVSRRTVQRHILRLEDADLVNGGLGMIRRVHRHRDDGGQSANCFELIGYEPSFSAVGSKVEKARKTSRDNLTPPHVTHDTGEGDTGVTGGGDNGVTRLGDKIIIPLSTPNGVDAPPLDLGEIGEGEGEQAEAGPAGRDRTPTRLPDDWTAPRLDVLSPKAQSLVRQWPSGAFEAACETFRLYWQNETGAKGRKANWDAALAVWCIRDHSKIMRDAKAGVSFASLSPAAAGAALGNGGPVSKPRTVQAKAGEGDRAKAMRKWLRAVLSPVIYDQWMDNTGIVWDGSTLFILTAGVFQRDWIADKWTEQIARAARDHLPKGTPLPVPVVVMTEDDFNQKEGAHRE